MDRLSYLEHFLDCVDMVSAGRKGSISEDKKLFSEYDSSFYSLLEPHIKSSDPKVRRETILLLSKLKEKKALEKVKEVRISDNDTVVSACIAYLSAIEEDDTVIPDLIETLRHTRGTEFNRAAMKLTASARAENIPALREVLAGTDGEMKEKILNILRAIINRNRELKPRSYLILADPVYPNEEKFMKFMDKSSVYLDIRYRDNVAERDSISLDTYNKVADGIKKIQIRLYCEKPNLRYYSDEAKNAYDEVEDLLGWAFSDLKSKKIIGNGAAESNEFCPRCGAKTAHSEGRRICPECGLKI